MVRMLPCDHYQRELRLFATGCVRRTWPLLEECFREAIVASEDFANGLRSQSELESICAVAIKRANEIDLGGGSPSSRHYAVSAAVDASSIWQRTPDNVLAVTSCAAAAIACGTADLDESHYDSVFEETRSSELVAQASLLRSLVNFPAGESQE